MVIIMGQDVELYKYNWDRLVLDIKNLGITDIDMLEKILLAFGEKCGNRYYLLDNEVYDEYNSFYSLIAVIEEYFNIEEDKIGTVIINNKKAMNRMCRSSFEVREELGL